jgi:hypothetical protein
MIKPNDNAHSLSEKAEAAFEQASQKVIERARQTQTPVVIWEDGRIVQVPGEAMQQAKTSS